VGASAIHIPFHTTWVHEKVTEELALKFEYHTVSNIKDVLRLL
jgi:putative hydrolase of the HAD superfamily